MLCLWARDGQFCLSVSSLWDDDAVPVRHIFQGFVYSSQQISSGKITCDPSGASMDRADVPSQEAENRE